EVYVQGRFAYVSGGGSDNLKIYDVTNPAAPVLVSTTSTNPGPDGVAIEGRYAYVANNGSNLLDIFDISSPSAPSIVSATPTSASPNKVYVQGHYAFVLWAFGMQIFDVSNPASPVSLGSVTGIGPTAASIQVRFAYIGSSNGSGMLKIVDLGGGYIQQFETGSVEVSNSSVKQNISIGNNASIAGGLVVGRGLQSTGDSSFYAGSPGTTPLKITGTGAQTADLVQAQDS